MVNDRLHDPNDEVRAHEGKEGEEAIQAIIKRLRGWVDRQPPEVAVRFCEHGCYVGYKRALAYRCEMCPEE